MLPWYVGFGGNWSYLYLSIFLIAAIIFAISITIYLIVKALRTGKKKVPKVTSTT